MHEPHVADPDAPLVSLASIVLRWAWILRGHHSGTVFLREAAAADLCEVALSELRTLLEFASLRLELVDPSDRFGRSVTAMGERSGFFVLGEDQVLFDFRTDRTPS